MWLRSHALLLPVGVAIVSLGPGVDSFRSSTGTLPRVQFRDRKSKRRSLLTYIRGGAWGAGKLRSGALKLGVGLLALGGATIYLYGSLPSHSAAADPTSSGEGSQARGGSSTPLPVYPSSGPSVSARDDVRSFRQGQGQEQEEHHRQHHHQQEVTMLGHIIDSYNGVIIDDKSLPKDTDAFKEALEGSLEVWRSEGRKGVWLKVPADRTELVPVSRELGFELHHAEKAYIMLNMWLPETNNQLPANASHQVGVGAIVMNDAGDILVVKEKNGPLRGTGIWKFPTGLIDAGEDIPEAAAREVLEETGIHAEFESVLAFRHGHKGLFGKSDLFFVVRMRLKPGTDAKDLRAQASEIEACEWMPFDLFVEQNGPESGGTALLRALTPVVEAHLALEAEKADLLQAGTGAGSSGTSNGAAGTSNGAAGTSNGVAGIINGAASTSNGAASTTNGIASTTNGAAGTSHGAVGTSNGAAGTSNGADGAVAAAVEAEAEMAGAKAAAELAENEAWIMDTTSTDSRPSGAAFVPTDILSKYGGGRKSMVYFGRL